MPKQLPPIPTEVLGTGTKILEKDGIRAALSYAYNHGAKVAVGRVRDRASFRREYLIVDEEATLQEVAGYRWAVETCDNLIKEYTRET
jgi:hypothetical protein